MKGDASLLAEWYAVVDAKGLWGKTDLAPTMTQARIQLRDTRLDHPDQGPFRIAKIGVIKPKEPTK